MKRCVKCEVLEVRNGYRIHREEDKQVDFLTGKPVGRTTVFYTVNEIDENGNDGMMLESFKTIREARKWADNN